MNVVRHQVNQQIGNAGNKLLGLREGPDVFSYARIAARQGPEFRHEVRVAQKANVEDQIGVFGQAVAIAEAHARNKNALLRRLLAETFRDVDAQFMHVELRCIDHDVSQRADALQVASFGLERGIDWRVRAQGMGAASLAETAHQYGIGGFQEGDLGRNHSPNCLQNAGKLLKLGAFADIDDERGAADLSRL